MKSDFVMDFLALRSRDNCVRVDVSVKCLQRWTRALLVLERDSLAGGGSGELSGGHQSPLALYLGGLSLLLGHRWLCSQGPSATRIPEAVGLPSMDVCRMNNWMTRER